MQNQDALIGRKGGKRCWDEHGFGRAHPHLVAASFVLDVLSVLAVVVVMISS